MNKLSLEIFVLGELETNSYLVYDLKAKKGFIVDVPVDTDALRKKVAKNGINIEFILLTHGHFDHIGGLDDFSSPAYIHEADARYFNDNSLNGSAVFSAPLAIKKEPVLFKGGALISFGEIKIKVIHTPGHTPGGVCFLLDNWLFSGDTLFLNSVGRTDLPFGSHNSLLTSIKSKLLVLPPSVIVYPGHGEKTTIKTEKARNPFLT